ncbi:MAG: NADH:ubiquinone reductase (Na(+)-transporting) subunit D [Clostridiaceae bacterium]
MATETPKQVAIRNIWTDNQVLRQILGICSSLAVTNRMQNSLVMGLGVIFATALSSLTLSSLRNYIPQRIRMIIQVLVISFYVIIVNIFLQAFMPDISKQLGPYVGLIITNCIIMGRAEAYAAKNPPFVSLLDGLFAGIGYTIVLLLIAVIRETLGFGTFFGVPLPFEFTKWTIMVMPPAAFFIIGTFIWAVNNYQAKQEEKKGVVRSGSLTIQKKQEGGAD